MTEAPRHRRLHDASARARARRWGLVFLAALAATLSSSAMAPAWAAPIAGTPIDNTASGSGVAAGGATIGPMPSNTVRAVVQRLDAVVLSAPAPVVARPGDTVVFPHRVRNTGNAAGDFRLDVVDVSGGDFSLLSPAIVLDANRDGVVDAGDTPLASGGTITLAAGDSAAVLLTATVPPAAPGLSQASIRFTATSVAQGVAEAVLDTVLTPVLGPPPTVGFYTGSDFTQTTTRARLGGSLYVQVVAPLADQHPAEIDTVAVRIDTRLTGDREIFPAIETGPHTGVFRIQPAVTTVTAPAGARAAAGGNAVNVSRGDEVSASVFGYGAPQTKTSLWVDPTGIVFDTGGGAGVSGARVQLVDVTGAGNGGHPGGLARVLSADGVTPASADVFADALGEYEFPWVAPSTYRLQVTPPASYRFPSLVPFASLGPGHVLDVGGSYGRSFAVTENGAPVVMDLPLDAVHPVVLFAEKAAASPEAEIGDDVGYQVRVANGSDSTLAAITVRDAMPAGFAYVAGSARVNGGAVAEPSRAGGTLTFAIGSLAPRATTTLAYRAHVGAGAALGDALNRAVAFYDGAPSNEAVARVTVRGGVFADEGVILGTVGLDTDRDGRLSAGEPGIPGVRIVMDDGTWAITDGRGRYSFTGVAPRTHVLKVDPATLPAALTLIALDHRDGDQPGLRFVDLTRGDMVRADFAAQGDTAALRQARAHGMAAGRSETDRLVARGTDLLVTPQPAADPRTLPASRVLTGESGVATGQAEAPAGAGSGGPQGDAAPGAAAPSLLASPAPEAGGAQGALTTPTPESGPATAADGPGATGAAGGTGTAAAIGSAAGAATDAAAPSAASVIAASVPPAQGAAPSSAPKQGTATHAAPQATMPLAASPAPGMAPLEQLVPALDATAGFVGLADLDTVPLAQIAVRVKGAAGTHLELRVNGRVVPPSRVARRVVASGSGVEALEYLGVALEPGVNRLEVASAGAPALAAVRVVAPGPLAQLVLRPVRQNRASDGAPARVTLSLLDARGVPVGARTLVTLETTFGRVRLDDLDPSTPGVQIAVEGGRADVPLESPLEPGVARLTASAGELRATASVTFTSELRRPLAVGTLEGVLGWNAFPRRGSSADLSDARFEAPVQQFATQSADGEFSAAARGAFYMKGQVAGPWSLTLGYDSDRERDARRFRDLQPDEGYNVLGDASVRGYDAQSTGRLYSRLERPGAWLLYGDYVTNGIGTSPEDGSRALAAYSRSFTGAQTRFENGPVRVDAFTSRDRTHSRTDELPGLGISGPYQLLSFPFVENSEQVSVVVRDRDHPSVVLSVTPRERFTDYEAEPFTGRLLFRMPVPSYDGALNPVSVRVTYEVRDADGGPGGSPFWVSGGTARWKALSRLELSGTAVDDHDPTAPRELRGAAFRAQLAARTSLEGEWAQTRLLGLEAGQAGRFEVRHASQGVEARVWGAATGTRFDNPLSGFSSGRDEAGAKVVARLAPRTRLDAEASFSGDSAGSDRRYGGLVSVDQALSDAVHGELGMRVSNGTALAPGADPLIAAVHTKLSWQPPAHPEWTSYAEGEQDVRQADQRMAAIGAEYRIAQRGRLYARHELISSLGDTWDLNGAQQRLATVVGMDTDVRRDQHLFSEYRLADALSGREAQASVGLRNGWQLSPVLRLGTSFERVSTLGGGQPAPGATTAATAAIDFTGETGWKGSSRLELRGNRTDTQVLQTMTAAVQMDSAWTALFRYALDVTNAYAADTTGSAQARVQLGLAWRPGGAWEGLARWEGRYDRGASALAPSALPTGGPDPRGRRLAGIVSINTDGRLPAGDVVSLAWAGKLTQETSADFASTGAGQWVRARATRDLPRNWDVGWTASLLTGARWNERRWGLGAEAGRQLPMGTWLSVGYNVFGFQDAELTGEEYTRAGVYLRLRMKVDETSLGRLGGTP